MKVKCNINVIATYKPSYAIPFAENYAQGIRLRIHLLFSWIPAPLAGCDSTLLGITTWGNPSAANDKLHTLLWHYKRATMTSA